MPTFEAGTIVRVPFPYTDRGTTQHRPALVVSESGVGLGGRLLWTLMITSAGNQRWPDDIELIDDHRACGLPSPSLIRTAKIATIDDRFAEPIGRLDAPRLGLVRQAIRHIFEGSTR